MEGSGAAVAGTFAYGDYCYCTGETAAALLGLLLGLAAFCSAFLTRESDGSYYAESCRASGSGCSVVLVYSCGAAIKSNH